MQKSNSNGKLPVLKRDAFENFDPKEHEIRVKKVYHINTPYISDSESEMSQKPIQQQMQIEKKFQKSKKDQDLQNKKKIRRRKSFSDSDSYFSAESDSDDSLASVKTIASEKNSKRKNNFNNGYFPPYGQLPMYPPIQLPMMMPPPPLSLCPACEYEKVKGGKNGKARGNIDNLECKCAICVQNRRANGIQEAKSNMNSYFPNVSLPPIKGLSTSNPNLASPFQLVPVYAVDPNSAPNFLKNGSLTSRTNYKTFSSNSNLNYLNKPPSIPVKKGNKNNTYVSLHRNRNRLIDYTFENYNPYANSKNTPV